MTYIHAGQRLLAAVLSPPDWTPMSPLLNSWTNSGGSEPTAQYRLWELINEVEVIGAIGHAAISGNSQFYTLPFTPATNQRKMLDAWNSTNVFASSATTPELILTTTGALSLQSLPAGTTSVQFHAWLSLDA